MEPPTRPAWESNFKPRTHSAKNWEKHKATFEKLYITDDLDLSRVRETLALVYGFYATERQCKNIVKKWKLEKNIKKNDMLLMINKREKRKLDEGKETEFSFRHRPVGEEKFERFQKRFKPLPESPAATPSDIDYWTPRNTGPDTPMAFSERGGDTPRPFDHRSPLIVGDSISEQSTYLSGVLQQSPVMRNAASPSTFPPPPTSYPQNDHHPFYYPRSQITHDLEAGGSPQPQLFINPSIGESAGGGFHALSSDIGDQDLIHGVDAPSEDVLDVEISEGLKTLFESARLIPENITGSEFHAALGFVSQINNELLTIKLAGAYIANSGASFATYLPLYNDSLKWVFGQILDETPTNDSRYAIAAFEISFQAMQRENGQSADILLTCAFLHHEGILDDVICLGLGLPQGDLTIGKAIDKMLAYSLVERLTVNGVFSIPPSIHSWLRKRLDSQTRRKKMKNAVQILENLIPPRREENSKHWMVGELAQHHLQLCFQYYLRSELSIEEMSSILISMAAIAFRLNRNGWLKEAEGLEIPVLAMRKKVLGEEHPHTLTSMASLALAFRKQGQLKEAEDLYVQVLAMNKEVLGEEHPDTLTSMGNLASTFRSQGWLKEAEDLEVQVLAMNKKVLGEEHLDTLTSMGNLALTFWSQGRFKEAGDLEVQVLAMNKKVLGEEHPDTLTSMSNLASAFRRQERLKEAEDLEVQVLAMKKKVLGEEHHDTLISMANLALTFRRQGRLKDAEDLGVQVLAMNKKVLGEENPHTLTSMANLASMFRSQGRLKEAEDLEVQVLAMEKKVLGEEHPHTLTSMANLASTFRSQGRLKEAEDLEVQVLAMNKKVLGEEHPDTLTSMANLASTFWSQERLKEAEDLGVQVLAMRKKVLGEEHPDTLTSMGNLASTFWSQGRLKEAEDLEVQVLAMRKKVLGEEHPDTLTSMTNLASTFLSQGRWKDAEDLKAQEVALRN